MNTTAMSLPKPFTPPSPRIPSTAPHRYRYRHLHLRPPIKCKSSSDNATAANDGSSNAPPQLPPPVTPPKTVEIRFRRRASRKSRQQQDGVVTSGMPKKAQPPKDWESMTMTEKAIELYVGEKGLLFWLNKLAYASIFVIIGAWILFRFVGPALNLYQLDSAPLSPTSILKGS